MINREHVTAADACEMLGPDVTREMIRDWVRRGLLEPVGRVPGGPSLFRAADVLEAEHRTRTADVGRKRRDQPLDAVPSRGRVTISQQVTVVEAAQVTLARRRCTVVKRSGKDCDAFVAETAPITVCRDHMRAAYLWYGDQLTGGYDPTSSPSSRPIRSPIDDLLGRQGDRDQSEGLVYYVRFGDRIKIGFSRDIRTRLGAIPHDEILAVEPGYPELERLRHKQFGDARLVREWFESSDHLMSHITMLRGHYGVPDKNGNVHQG